MLVPRAAGDSASPGLTVPRELWAEGRPVSWKVWSHLAEQQGEQDPVLVSFLFIPTKGVHIGNGLGCCLPSHECPLAPPRWAGECVRDCWAVAPHFRCVTCFWAEPRCLWLWRRCLHAQPVFLGSCATHMHCTCQNGIKFLKMHLCTLFGGGDCTRICLSKRITLFALKICASYAVAWTVTRATRAPTRGPSSSTPFCSSRMCPEMSSKIRWKLPVELAALTDELGRRCGHCGGGLGWGPRGLHRDLSVLGRAALCRNVRKQ